MTRVLLIILAAHVPSARALAQSAPFSLSEEEAERLFVPAGSPTGDAPATHYWAAGLFTAEFWNAIQGLAMVLPWAHCHTYDIETQPAFPVSKLVEMGLQPMKGEQP